MFHLGMCLSTAKSGLMHYSITDVVNTLEVYRDIRGNLDHAMDQCRRAPWQQIRAMMASDAWESKRQDAVLSARGAVA